ncbi:nucleotide exchange factor GrpE [Natronobacterium texcoconense]|uniref:Protein GrpE n=1 Tax=Natronobacterium texcoconense TaxID=1095778 RepID=A0A1H1ESH5_NATTX|nr:nucleotide exchange factor GrpE [Natronobacterium texcoconense]SDQ91459.1 molecular chaperone GrpE [Natronobacterium texcoconense]
MSEDEGTNPSAQGVPSEEKSDDGETTSADQADVPADEDDVGQEDADASATADESTTEDDAPSSSESDESSTEDEGSPETSSDVQSILERVNEYDDRLAHKVNSIVDQARDLSGTVQHQREELHDLSERVEAQAQTIEDLQSELEAHRQAVDERDAQLEEYEEEIEDLKSRLKRKQADFQNYKKRAKKRQEQIKDRATEDLVERLVDVRDNLKRALEEESGDADSLRDGVEMTLREFDRILEDENVTEIDPEPGEEIDPQRHEVMMNVDSDQPEGTIADVYTAGYEMGDKVIQNAQVTVSNGELAGDAEQEGDDPTDADGTDDEASDGENSDDEEAIELGGEVEEDAGDES